MGTISDLKNSIRNAIYTADNSINFSFEKMPVAEFPFVFFYIASYRLEKPISPNYWRKLNLMCVIEYMESEENDNITLWNYAETLSKTYNLFPFLDTKLSAKNVEFRISNKDSVHRTLQMTFDLEFYVKEIDETELMKELDLTLTTRPNGQIDIEYMEEIN